MLMYYAGALRAYAAATCRLRYAMPHAMPLRFCQMIRHAMPCFAYLPLMLAAAI